MSLVLVLVLVIFAFVLVLVLVLGRPVLSYVYLSYLYLSQWSQTMAVMPVFSIVDYSISVLVDITAYLVHRLQSVLNAAARLVYRLKRSDHVMSLMLSLVFIGCEYHSVSSTKWRYSRTKSYTATLRDT